MAEKQVVFSQSCGARLLNGIVYASNTCANYVFFLHLSACTRWLATNILAVKDNHTQSDALCNAAYCPAYPSGLIVGEMPLCRKLL